MNQTVGMIGLGQMGTAMATHLLAADYRVVGHDTVTERRDALDALGGEAVGSAREVATTADRVITSLPSSAALHDVLFGDDGVLAAGREVVVIETSTLELAEKERARARAAEASVVVVDCPLSGTASQARAGDLVVYASGDTEALESCRPIFEAFSRSHVMLGAFGAGSKMKYLANMLVTIHNVAAAEAMVLGMKAGLDPGQVFDVISSGAGTSRMFEIRGPLMVENSYEPVGMPAWLYHKDVRIIAEFARSLDCPMPLFSTCAELHTALLGQGLGDLDTAAICTVLERMAGHVRDGG
jgi:L-threonate 2-dehydrogenase